MWTNASSPGSATAVRVPRFELQQIGLDARAQTRTGVDDDRERRGDAGVAIDAGDHADAEHDSGGADAEGDLVARNRPVHQIRETAEPLQPRGWERDHGFEPGRECRRPERRQLRQGERRQAGRPRHAHQAHERLERPGRNRVGLDAQQSEHEFEDGIVELVEIVEGEGEIARGGRARQQQIAQRQPEHRRCMAARRKVQREAKPT